MVNFLQKRVVNYKELCSKELISDLKEAATCEVRRVCCLPFNRCPLPVENINVKKVNIKGLNSYSIKLKKVENEELLIIITAPHLDNWLLRNNLSFTTQKTITRRQRRPSKTRLLVTPSKKLIYKAVLELGWQS